MVAVFVKKYKHLREGRADKNGQQVYLQEIPIASKQKIKDLNRLPGYKFYQKVSIKEDHPELLIFRYFTL